MSLNKDNIEVSRFIEFVKQQCIKHRIRLHLPKDEAVYVAEGTACNGYFDEHSRELAVATGKPFEKWFPTLVHEYGHMTQWIDQCQEWKRLYVTPDYTSEELVELWLSGLVELTPEKLHDYISRSRKIEFDCEKRTMALIKKHRLPIDLKEYARKANSYAMFWAWMEYTRKWYDIGKEPYNTPELFNNLPEIPFTEEQFDKIPDSVREIYRKAYPEFPEVNKENVLK